MGEKHGSFAAQFSITFAKRTSFPPIETTSPSSSRPAVNSAASSTWGSRTGSESNFSWPP